MTIPNATHLDLAVTRLVPLAKELDEDKVTPGVLGFIVFALIGGAVWLLMKNMNKQFRKIDFEEPVASGAGERAEPGRSVDKSTDRPGPGQQT